MDVLKRVRTSGGPIDHEGEFYRFAGAQPAVKPVRGRLPICCGGSSADAYRVGGRHADMYALWGEPLKETAEQIAAIRAAAAGQGSDPSELRFSVSFRPIIAPTDAQAWERAHHILDVIVGGSTGPAVLPPRPSRRTLGQPDQVAYERVPIDGMFLGEPNRTYGTWGDAGTLKGGAGLTPYLDTSMPVR